MHGGVKVKHAASSPVVAASSSVRFGGVARGGEAKAGDGAHAPIFDRHAPHHPQHGPFSNGQWARHVDDATGIAYLYNATTGEESVCAGRRQLLLSWLIIDPILTRHAISTPGESVWEDDAVNDDDDDDDVGGDGRASMADSVEITDIYPARPTTKRTSL